MRLCREIVRESLEGRGSAARRVRERLRDEPIGEPGVARQKRTVQVGSDRPFDATTLKTGRSVVPEAVQHSPERKCVFIEHRSTRVVLEACKRVPLSGLELAFE